MSKTYEHAPDEVSERASEIIEKFHDDLYAAEVKIDYIYARNDKGYAVTHHGNPALAVVRIVSLKDRAKGHGDAEITIDADAYEAMSGEQKDGLLDHELYHLIVRYAKDGCVKTDDLNRPMFKMRKHDWDMGWFTAVARRHGRNSPEVTQAQILWANDGQAYFPMLTDGEAQKDSIDISERVVDAFAENPPNFGDGIDSVKISAGGKSVTIKKGKVQRTA
jgi:hypothetical protein